MNNYVVYEIINPETKKTFYVGMSMNPLRRFKRHLYGESHPTRAVIYPLKSRGLKPIFKVVNWDLSKSEALSFEESLTCFYRQAGHPIVNLNSGAKLASEVIKKVSLSQRGKARNTSSILKMAATRKAQCKEGSERDRLLFYNESRKTKIKDHCGNIYESIHDCERRTGCKRPSIKKVLTGKQSQTKGYRFEYV